MCEKATLIKILIISFVFIYYVLNVILLAFLFLQIKESKIYYNDLTSVFKKGPIVNIKPISSIE